MLYGQRAFKRNTGAETMSAILKEEPSELSGSASTIPAALERIVRHCMEKQPAQRFQSAQDIAFALESVTGISSTSSTAATAPARKGWAGAVLAGLALLTLAGLGLGVWLRPSGAAIHPRLHRITFRRGTIWNARFTSDGNLVYGAAWEGQPEELFVAENGSTESRTLGLKITDILAISNSGELAVSTNRHFVMGFESAGMLAPPPRGGGAARAIADDVGDAAWSPDGASIAVVRRVGGKRRAGEPPGQEGDGEGGVVDPTPGMPGGKSVGFGVLPPLEGDGGLIIV